MKIPYIYCMAGILMFLNCTVAYPQQSAELQRLRNCLYRDGKPVGQPFTSQHTDIRMLRVSSYKEAWDFFMDLSKGTGKLQNHSASPFTYCRYTLPGNKGYFIFTDKVKPKRNEVAILWMHIDSIAIKEIHFVETIKIKATD